MRLLSAPWWGAFVSGLQHRAVAAFAVDLGVSEAELLAALRDADTGGPAEAAPWWPEALRERGTLGIRALARKYGCEPRRIRRALARTGLRVDGEDIDGWGVPALRPFRGRLGRESDAVLARTAGVPVEAVQGERRRLGIAAYYPGEAPQLMAEEEAFVRGPEAVRRGRLRPEPANVQVVRRPTLRGEVPAREDPLPRGPGIARAPRVEPVGERDGGPPAEPRALHRVPTAFFQGRSEDELERLLQPATRPREGRQRIVRAPLPRSSPGVEREAGGPAVAAVATETVAPMRTAPAATPRPAVTTTAPKPAVTAAPAAKSRPAITTPVKSKPAAPPAAARPNPTPPPRPVRWTVDLPEAPGALVVEASDVAEALALAALALPPAAFARASIAAADAPRWAPLPDPGTPIWSLDSQFSPI